jgi:hypothetical protein
MIKTEKEPASLCLSGATEENRDETFSLFPSPHREMCVSQLLKTRSFYTPGRLDVGGRERLTHTRRKQTFQCVEFFSVWKISGTKPDSRKKAFFLIYFQKMNIDCYNDKNKVHIVFYDIKKNSGSYHHKFTSDIIPSHKILKDFFLPT